MGVSTMATFTGLIWHTEAHRGGSYVLETFSPKGPVRLCCHDSQTEFGRESCMFWFPPGLEGSGMVRLSFSPVSRYFAFPIFPSVDPSNHIQWIAWDILIYVYGCLMFTYFGFRDKIYLKIEPNMCFKERLWATIEHWKHICFKTPSSKNVCRFFFFVHVKVSLREVCSIEIHMTTAADSCCLVCPRVRVLCNPRQSCLILAA